MGRGGHLDKMTSHILLSAAPAADSGHLTKSKLRETTIFLPKDAENLIPQQSLKDLDLLRHILLCSSVEVNAECFPTISPVTSVSGRPHV